MMIIIGRFSEENAMVNENAKARGKDWTRLPMPLCHWLFWFLDLRALSSMLSRCLCQIYQWKTWSRGTNGRLLFTLKVTVNLSNDNDNDNGSTKFGACRLCRILSVIRIDGINSRNHLCWHSVHCNI